MAKFKIIIGIFLFSLIFVSVWGFLIEPNLISTEKISIKAESMSDSLKDLKFLQISDLHLKEFSFREEKVLKIIKSIKPDLVFITGDIVDWSTKDFTGLEKFSKDLSADYKDKIFAVFGNHDHRNNKFKTLKDVLKENGIQVLINESRKLETNDSYFYLIGVDDPHLGYDDIDKATAGIGEDSFKILLAHSPEIFRKITDKKINLVLVGHAHGCQVGIPFLCDLFLPLNYDKKYKRGLFKENSTYLYVNRGIGETILPFRLNAFPEITIINFE
ncbi:MAG: metallophosphoesterase [Parcubacteria group bacterium]